MPKIFEDPRQTAPTIELDIPDTAEERAAVIRDREQLEARASGETTQERGWAEIIRNDYDRAPDHFAATDTWIDGADEIAAKIEAALRQRADEATRAENEACAKILDERAVNHYEAESHYHYIIGNILTDLAAAIRARIAS